MTGLYAFLILAAIYGISLYAQADLRKQIWEATRSPGVTPEEGNAT